MKCKKYFTWLINLITSKSSRFARSQDVWAKIKSPANTATLVPKSWFTVSLPSAEFFSIRKLDPILNPHPLGIIFTLYHIKFHSQASGPNISWSFNIKHSRLHHCKLYNTIFAKKSNAWTEAENNWPIHHTDFKGGYCTMIHSVSLSASLNGIYKKIQTFLPLYWFEKTFETIAQAHG